MNRLRFVFRRKFLALVPILLIVVLVGMMTVRIRDERRLEGYLYSRHTQEGMNFALYRHGEMSWRSRGTVEAADYRTRLFASRLFGSEMVSPVYGVRISDCFVSAEDVRFIAEHSTPEYICIWRARISPKAVEELIAMDSLRCISLSDSIKAKQYAVEIQRSRPDVEVHE